MHLPPRVSGVLLPLFSLRAKDDAGVGDFAGVPPLLDWLVRAEQRLLMVLPLLPTAPGDPSPYGTRSAVGLNPLFLHLPWLDDAAPPTAEEAAQLELARAQPQVDYATVFPLKAALLERSFARFEQRGGDAAAFATFTREHGDWLTDAALFEALSEAQGRAPWWDWPAPLREREPSALEAATRQHARRVRYHQWLQWNAFSQWQRVRAEARSRGVELWGDEPFIIGQDSVDCWRFPRYLRRDARLGVPPDEFAKEGQDWGLPFFDFEALERDGDGWLHARARGADACFDARRVDHAIGYFRQYVRDEATPKGRFVPAEREAQRARGLRTLGLLSRAGRIVAEDLGVIPRFARDALAQLGLPGYQVMRWAKEDGVVRDPRHYPLVSLVTTGTHDTESLRAWWEATSVDERRQLTARWPTLTGLDVELPTFTPEAHEALLAAALQAHSAWCVLPWHDVFGELERVNAPGTVGPHNWSYRVRWPGHALLTEDEPLRRAEWLGRLTREAHRAR